MTRLCEELPTTIGKFKKNVQNANKYHFILDDTIRVELEL